MIDQGHDLIVILHEATSEMANWSTKDPRGWQSPGGGGKQELVQTRSTAALAMAIVNAWTVWPTQAVFDGESVPDAVSTLTIEEGADFQVQIENRGGGFRSFFQSHIELRKKVEAPVFPVVFLFRWIVFPCVLAKDLHCKQLDGFFQ